MGTKSQIERGHALLYMLSLVLHRVLPCAAIGGGGGALSLDPQDL